MIFSLAVYGAPYSSQASYSALQFAKATLANGHSLYRVFFYHDGVHNATHLAAPPQDEYNLTGEWRTLAIENRTDMVVCIAAALRRGIIDADEQKRYEKTASNLAAPFVLGGLGQLLDAAVGSDRLITFGN
ncbi:sulfurtransferase complex subunit TusD [Cellvibrio polysaccharolyticus]|uniref:Sulfurtransferase complex subunit TusD n=1 Tax=Cellvibrio polysaccharolyticus TaxID=2082724 RepID=A0A928YU75_9GAMM|nr:sulfurtransferase complex subunit TusD [Cellvibrio polysaccharolyticus]MBE8717734.1 sulfurtransferase complex subunit TusD [Cellvibrio polysaccharolyticus]